MIPKASDIKPKVKGQADFFSWQLYRYMKKYSDPQDQRIYEGTLSKIEGRTTLYIGRMWENKWFSGRKLIDLCCHGRSICRYAYGSEHDTYNWVDVTDTFWGEYMRNGVCAIHGDAAHNWLRHGEQRTCEYCGKVENRKIIMVEKEIWV